MAAFDRVKSGFPEVDTMLDNIRMGDNVVWRVSSLDQFRIFAGAFAKQAVEDGRNIIYIRFAEHDPILPEMEGVKVVHVKLSHLFETFTITIHNLIEQEGRDAFYVFDCLSELEEAWATDLLMGDFFHLTCPFLFTLDTVAFFPVIRGRHSYDAIKIIRDTTQLFIDVYPGNSLVDTDELYVRPVKVWNRNSHTMFDPHRFVKSTGECVPATEGVEVSRFYHQMNQAVQNKDNQNLDSWERFFELTKLKYENGIDVTEDCSRICDIMLTRDERMRKLIKANFRPEDYFDVHSRMVGTGMIGGKACGMLLARKIVENHRPDIFRRIEPHDSFYVGSDVFYTYIVDNGFWDLKIRHKEEENYFSLADEIVEEIMKGKFSEHIENEFRNLLDYYGNDPVIVRSSSILEDGFGNAFAGKYESVFCGCQGTLEERLEEFENAVRTVYASTAGLSALDYRKRRGLDKLDEQMALLVQRVSGSRYEDFFMPCAAGVGYSISPYRLGADHPEDGMLRLVAGLGTAAVDRRTGSYPRIVSLDDPSKVMITSIAERHQFSQRLIDVIGEESGLLENRQAERIAEKIPSYQAELLFSHDHEAERSLRDRGIRRQVQFVTCEGLVKNESLMDDFRGILNLIHAHYQHAVDIEYTINVSKDGEYVIDLLQCRPLQQTRDGDIVSFPAPEEYDRVLLETKGVSMGFSRSFAVDIIVYIDAIAYYEMPYADKGKVKAALSAINWKTREQKKHMVLFTPGRICTSSPELGVPSSFAEISEFDAIFEVSESRAGYIPELSYGSHIFQDLVESEILYTAVFEADSTIAFHPEYLKESGNKLADYYDKEPALADVVFVKEPEGVNLYYDVTEERLLITERKAD